MERDKEKTIEKEKENADKQNAIVRQREAPQAAPSAGSGKAKEIIEVDEEELAKEAKEDGKVADRNGQPEVISEASSSAPEDKDAFEMIGRTRKTRAASASTKKH